MCSDLDLGITNCKSTDATMWAEMRTDSSLQVFKGGKDHGENPVMAKNEVSNLHRDQSPHGSY